MTTVMIPIDLSSIIYAAIVYMIWMIVKEYVEYRTGKTGQSKPQLVENLTKMFVGEIRQSVLEILPMYKYYKSKTSTMPLVGDIKDAMASVTNLIQDMDIVKEDVSKLKEEYE